MATVQHSPMRVRPLHLLVAALVGVAGVVAVVLAMGSGPDEAGYLSDVHSKWAAEASRVMTSTSVMDKQMAALTSPNPDSVLPEALGWTDAELLQTGRGVCVGKTMWAQPNVGSVSGQIIINAAREHLCS